MTNNDRISMLHERIGAITEQLGIESQQHLSTIALLRRIKEGEVDIVNVVINENGWRLAVAKEPGLELRTATDGDGND